MCYHSRLIQFNMRGYWKKKSAFIRRSPECEQSHDRESNQELDHQDAVHLKKERKYLFYVLAYKVYKST